MDKFHTFVGGVGDIAIPERFNNPFSYRPHPLCMRAADEVRRVVEENPYFRDEVANGKMFGVLLVKSPGGEYGFLAAFSGLLCGENEHAFFVPPVFDFLSLDGYFKCEERNISNINKMIAEISSSADYKEACDELAHKIEERDAMLGNEREAMRVAKEQRAALRQAGGLTAEETERLLNASRFEKAEYKRHTKYWDAIIATYKEVVDHFESRITDLKRERKERSAALQQWLFDNFVFRNIDGEVASLSHIFSNTKQGVPPAGAGECAAPKLLQYAFLNGMRPIAMAEFWMGESPIGEVRRDGCFYGSCTSKCKPILGFMLRGMDVEESVLEQRMSDTDIEVLYDDDYLCVVNKPSGMLSVPGVVGGVSLEEHLQSKHGRDAYIRVVHRLDMFTSGLLVVAKSSEVYIALQRQFADREVSKRYSALLDGVIDCNEGEISLPLSADYENRPRQRVDKISGKSAITKYRVVSELTYKGRRCTHVHFFPLTGRTHQLRMHAAHSEGLNCPIVGDELYGVPDERLMLHAEYICFKHPISGCNIELEIPFKLHE